MKLIRNTLAIAALMATGLTLAQTTTPAKPAATKPAAAKPAAPAAKPKEKLMTRDELRSCLMQVQANEDEGVALKAAEKEIFAERDTLKVMQADHKKADEEFVARSQALKAELDALSASGEAIKANAAKMSKDELKAKQDEYAAKGKDLQPRIDAFNKELQARKQDTSATTFNARVEAFNKALNEHNEKVEDLADKKDEWKRKCGNKPYDEADELAIKKELKQGAK